MPPLQPDELGGAGDAAAGVRHGPAAISTMIRRTGSPTTTRRSSSTPDNFIVHYAHGWIDPSGFGGMCKKVIGTQGAVEIGGERISLHDKSRKVEPLKSSTTTTHRRQCGASSKAFARDKPILSPVENGRNASLVGLLVRKAVDERARRDLERNAAKLLTED